MRVGSSVNFTAHSDIHVWTKDGVHGRMITVIRSLYSRLLKVLRQGVRWTNSFSLAQLGQDRAA